MSRHLTPEERAALGAMLTDAAPDVAALIATWVRANVSDFATADAIGTVLMGAARMLRDAEAPKDGWCDCPRAQRQPRQIGALVMDDRCGRRIKTQPHGSL
jgi:hypothetical protein